MDLLSALIRREYWGEKKLREETKKPMHGEGSWDDLSGEGARERAMRNLLTITLDSYQQLHYIKIITR